VSFSEQVLATAIGAVIGGAVAVFGQFITYWTARKASRSDQRRAAVLHLQDLLIDLRRAALLRGRANVQAIAQHVVAPADPESWVGVDTI
jgi:hypothetical protein